MADGLIFGTGTVKVGGETLGVLQNVSFSISTSQAELRGGGSKFPVKVVTTTKGITGSAEFARCEADVLGKVLGVTPTAGTGTKTIAISDDDETVYFELTLEDPSDNTGVAIKLYRCMSTNFSMAFSNENFMIPNFEFAAMADTEGKVMDITLPDVV